MSAKKINYTGDSKVIKRLCESVNEIIDSGGGGGGGDDDPRLHRTLKIHVVNGELHISGVATD